MANKGPYVLSRESALRLGRTIRHHDSRPAPAYGWGRSDLREVPPRWFVPFVLTETLEAPDGSADAHRRVWDPSANGGDGGFTEDTSETITVRDAHGIGYYGEAGAVGWSVIYHADLGIQHVIVDLICP